MQNYIGKQIDRYRIIERLGMGGMAVVYKAYDTRLEREVAVKLIRTDEIPASQHERLMMRFEREAKAQARFDHKHIVHVYDYGEFDGSPYLVMATVPGGTLKTRMNRPVDWRQAVEWLIPIADALSYAHQNGVIHRDVKPANILFDSSDQPMLTDFGIAKVLETTEATLTGTGLGVGTPEYMAPEQWQGKACEATDQYALGVVLYELITGQKPYTADTPAAVAILQATEPLRAPSKLVEGIPLQVEKVLYKALAKHPEDRYPSMAVFQNALKALLSADLNQPIEHESGVEPGLRPAGIPKVDSEGETVDRLSGTPVRPVAPSIPRGGVAQSAVRNTNLPRWTLWVGLALVFVIVGAFAVYYFREDLFAKKAQTPTTFNLSDVLERLGVSGEDDNPTDIPSTPVVMQVSEPTKTDLPAFVLSEEATPIIIPSNTVAPSPTPTMMPTYTIAPSLTPTIVSDGTRVSPDGANLIQIPAGAFLMGSTQEDLERAISQSWCVSCQWDWFSDELDQHSVYLDAYWIYQKPVTNSQFAQFVEQTGHQTTAELQGWSWVFNGAGEKVNGVYWAEPAGEGSTIQGRADHPVVHISYADASAYCEWVGGRLPTEAEWEKAARGTDGRTYPWGDERPTCDLANFEDCGNGTQSVGIHPNGASPYDVWDMVGNVWEWVSDWYSGSYYSISPTDNPKGPSSGSQRVIRGGGWYTDIKYLRVTNRNSSGENDTSNDHGFRCVIPGN